MFDSLTSTNGRDFDQRYRNTYGFLHKDGAKKLIFITKIDSGRVFFTTADGESWWAQSDQQVMFEFLPLDRGFHNTENGLFFVTRVPARMWQRGIARNNTSVYQFKTRNWQQVEPSFESLSSIFEKPTEPDKALSRPTAISKYFAMSRGTVFLFSEAVGSYTKSKISLKPQAAIIEQELNDSLRRANFEMPVVVEN